MISFVVGCLAVSVVAQPVSLDYDQIITVSVEKLTEVDYHRETEHLVILHGVSVALRNVLRVNPLRHPKIS